MIAAADYFYWLAGVILLAISLLIARDAAHPRRWWSSLFWADLGLLFLIGDRMPPALVGVQVIGLTLIVAFGGLRRGGVRPLPPVRRLASAQRLGSKLLFPLLVIPTVTILGSVVFKTTKIGSLYLLDQGNQTLAALGVATIISIFAACWLTRDSIPQSIRQSRELTDAIGWTLVLPQMLSMLGNIFSLTGVGDSIAYLTTTYVATDTRWIVIVVYCIGMTIFSMIMGGGGAAFPLMMGGIGVPILINAFHGNPPAIAAIGMFSAFAGTLMTPMAAHFNLIPVALLELPDKYAVIKAQAPTALGILLANCILLYCLM